MPVKKIKQTAMAMGKRNRKSPIKQLPEWLEVQQVLAAGLRPHEAAEIVLNPATVSKMRLKHPYRMFMTLVKAYIREKELPYDVVTRNTGEQQIIYIVGR